MNSGALVFFQGKALSTSPAQKFEEAQTGVEDLVVLKHHFVEWVDLEVTVGVGIFECGHRGVKRVCLMAERGILHGDDLDSMLGGRAQHKHKPLVQTKDRLSDLSCSASMSEQYIMRWSMFVYLCYILSCLPQGFEDLLVVLQVDVCEHVSSHFVSFAQISLQALIVDFTLKLCYDWPRLNQADTEERREVQYKQNQSPPDRKLKSSMFS